MVGGRTCSDWEVLSSFDERPGCGRRYGGIVELCGCATDDGGEYDMPEGGWGCFEPAQLDGRTFFFVEPKKKTKFQYSVSFGPDGRFVQKALWNADDVRDVVVGYSRGTSPSPPPPSVTDGGKASDGEVRGEVVFSGGFPCGIYGTRTGLVRLVEKDGAARPEIVSLTEPEACRYVAVMNVPRFCEGADGGADGPARR